MLSTEGVIALSSFIMLMMVMFAGFLINYDSLPVFIRWAQYLSYFKYLFSGLGQVEFDGLTFYCKSDQYATTSDGSLICPITSGKQVIDSYGFNEFTILECYLWLIGYIVLFRVTSYVLLRWFARK